MNVEGSCCLHKDMHMVGHKSAFEHLNLRMMKVSGLYFFFYHSA